MDKKNQKIYVLQDIEINFNAIFSVVIGSKNIQNEDEICIFRYVKFFLRDFYIKSFKYMCRKS